LEGGARERGDVETEVLQEAEVVVDGALDEVGAEVGVVENGAAEKAEAEFAQGETLFAPGLAERGEKGVGEGLVREVEAGHLARQEGGGGGLGVDEVDDVVAGEEIGFAKNSFLAAVGFLFGETEGEVLALFLVVAVAGEGAGGLFDVVFGWRRVYWRRRLPVGRSERQSSRIDHQLRIGGKRDRRADGRRFGRADHLGYA
jgi:hypothetical protein